MLKQIKNTEIDVIHCGSPNNPLSGNKYTMKTYLSRQSQLHLVI